jgi:deoxyribonuclease-4
LGSRVDRHEHIGKGCIGLLPFAFFLQDRDFYNIPFILETPKENNMDFKNIAVLWRLKLNELG